LPQWLKKLRGKGRMELNAWFLTLRPHPRMPSSIDSMWRRIERPMCDSNAMTSSDPIGFMRLATCIVSPTKSLAAFSFLFAVAGCANHTDFWTTRFPATSATFPSLSPANHPYDLSHRLDGTSFSSRSASRISLMCSLVNGDHSSNQLLWCGVRKPRSLRISSKASCSGKTFAAAADTASAAVPKKPGSHRIVGPTRQMDATHGFTIMSAVTNKSCER
jgi:hypothetical protein